MIVKVFQFRSFQGEFLGSSSVAKCGAMAKNLQFGFLCILLGLAIRLFIVKLLASGSLERNSCGKLVKSLCWRLPPT